MPYAQRSMWNNKLKSQDDEQLEARKDALDASIANDNK